jgi:hypothetical protein
MICYNSNYIRRTDVEEEFMKSHKNWLHVTNDTREKKGSVFK